MAAGVIQACRQCGERYPSGVVSAPDCKDLCGLCRPRTEVDTFREAAEAAKPRMAHLVEIGLARDHGRVKPEATGTVFGDLPIPDARALAEAAAAVAQLFEIE